MNRINTQLKMHYINMKKSLIIFWSVMAGVLFLGLSIALYLRSRGIEGQVSTANNIMAVVIFCAISSSVSYYQTFPYTTGMGMTRRDFYNGTVAFNTLLSAFSAIVFNIYVLIDYALFRMMGFKPVIYMGYSSNHITISKFFINTVIASVFLMAVTSLFSFLFSISFKKGKAYLLGITVVFLGLITAIPKVRLLIFEGLKTIGLTFVGLIPPDKLIAYSLIFYVLFFLLLFPIVKKTEIKR